MIRNVQWFSVITIVVLSMLGQSRSSCSADSPGSVYKARTANAMHGLDSLSVIVTAENQRTLPTGLSIENMEYDACLQLKSNGVYPLTGPYTVNMLLRTGALHMSITTKRLNGGRDYVFSVSAEVQRDMETMGYAPKMQVEGAAVWLKADLGVDHVNSTVAVREAVRELLKEVSTDFLKANPDAKDYLKEVPVLRF